MSLLKIEIREGYAFKVLTELLQNFFKEACFVINSKGIQLKNIDTKSSKCVFLDLHRENFSVFILPPNEEDVKIGVNLLHFHKMLKPVKKKDIIFLSIDKENPFILNISINNSVAHIKITSSYPQEINIGDSNCDIPLMCSPKDFKQLKTLNKLSKYIKISSYNKGIKFFCDNDGVFSRGIYLGEEDKGIDKNYDNECFQQTFDTDVIISLVKISSLSNNVQIFPSPPMENFPLKFIMKVAMMGVITIYIKSKEQIELEQQQGDTTE
jgi:DNA polymerase III sliding clamp (beta) subunit (PCNA family)